MSALLDVSGATKRFGGLQALFGRSLIEPEVIRMLLFGLALVLIMLFRPAGLLPSAVRKRELTGHA